MTAKPKPSFGHFSPPLRVLRLEFLTCTYALVFLGGSGFTGSLIRIGAIAILYPFCKKFDRYKMDHKEQW